MNALRVRLSVFLIGLAGAVALAVGVATYLSVRTEADALFDYHLRQMALSLRDQGQIPEDERAVLENAGFDYVVQVWSADGVKLYSTTLAPPLPPRPVLGFSTIDIGGTAWRVYGAAATRRIVQVAQPLAVRRSLAASAAWHSVLPIALAAPLVALAVWWLVGASLSPLTRVVDAVRVRGANALDPLPADALPAEVAPLVEAFNALLARLARAFEAQHAFVADAAHELRSPLTALKLQIEVLRGAADEAQRNQAIARLAAGVERARHLVAQLLALARAGPSAAPRHDRVDLVEVVRQAVADALPLARTRRGEVEFEASAEVVVPGDPEALRSLASNLIDNALKHAGEAPRVQLSVGTRGAQAVLCVDDSGPGIPATDRERVFARFYRREPGRGSGSGLGLAIVRAIAQQHGGTALLADSPLGGLRVEVLLPLGTTTAAEAAGAA